MSYQPGRSNYNPNANQPIYPAPPPSQRPRPNPPARRKLSPLAGCSLFVIGIALGIVLTLGFGYFYLVSSSSGAVLIVPPNSGNPDITIELSQEYLNSQISSNLKANPVKLLNIVSVKGLTLGINPNSQIDVNGLLNTPLGDVTLGITEQVSASNGLVVVKSIGKPRLGNNNLPFDINGLVDELNRDFIQPQINQYVKKSANANGKPFLLTGLSTISGALVADFQAQ